MKNVQDRVREYLSKPSQPICDACIEHALRYPPKTVNPICNGFGANGVFDRVHGTCVVCKKHKLVNSYV